MGPRPKAPGALGPSYRIHMESVTTYCQGGFQLLSEMHPTTAYMHPRVSAYLHPTAAYFAPNHSIDMHPKSAYMHPKVSAYMHPKSSN